MSGFPTRPSRSAFGPKPIDRFPVRDPSRYGSAALFDLVFWQLSGLGVSGPVAFATLTSNGTTLSLVASGEAWDPDGAILPAVNRTTNGIFTLQYAATYLDKDGATVTTNLLGVIPVYQGLGSANSNRISAVINADKRTVDFRRRDNADSLADFVNGEGVMLLVF